MSRRLMLGIMACALAGLWPAPAAASPIVLDPTIGIRGRAGGSPEITDGHAFLLRNSRCVVPIEEYYCAPYDLVGGEGSLVGDFLFAVDLAFWYPDGTPVLACEVLDGEGGCNDESPNIVRDLGSSDFELIVYVSPYVVRLVVGQGSTIPPFVCFEGEEGCTPNTALVYAIEGALDRGRVSVQAYNGIANVGPAPGVALAVPEPGALLLMATGITFGWVRRRRRTGRRPG
jgi:hypothetical protein